MSPGNFYRLPAHFVGTGIRREIFTRATMFTACLTRIGLRLKPSILGKPSTSNFLDHVTARDNNIEMCFQK
jgi:hypothetical protein